MVPNRAWYFFAAILLSAFLLAGCPTGPTPNAGSADFTMLIAANDGGLQSKSPVLPKARVVSLEELLRLTITVDAIRLTSAEGDVSLLDEPFDLNLLDILNMPNLIDAASVPAGAYTGAVLMLSNAMAVFSDAPETAVAVDLLDGGSLTVPTSFETVDGGEGLLVFDLGAVTLVEFDAGGYQLVPDFAVDVFNAVQAQVRGEIVETSPEDAFIVVRRGDAEVVVDVLDGAIFLPEDFDVAHGTVDDLVVGADVVVLGTLNFHGSLTATTVAILAFPDDDDEDPTLGKIRYALVSTGNDPDAEGYAEYKNNGTHSKLTVKMDDLTLVRVVEVHVDGAAVGDARVNRHSEKAMLHLVSARGDLVPAMTVDSVIEVFDAETGESLLVSEMGVFHEPRAYDDDRRDDDDDDDDEDD